MISQTGEHGAKSSSVVNLYRRIVANEGVKGLWAGNGANLVRVFPAKGIVFSSNDVYRSFLKRMFSVPAAAGDKQQTLPVHLSFVSGGMSGMTATLLTYPLDFARGRISGKLGSRSAGGKHHYSGIWNAIYVSAKEEGFVALFKGMTPTLLGAVPYEGIKFGTVGLLERYFPIKEENPGVLRKVIFGGCGGVMAGLITYPNDTVRRMLQMQGSRGTTDVYTGYWDCVRKVYASHGMQRFYHGVTINLIRMAPNTAIQFGSYELLKKISA